MLLINSPSIMSYPRLFKPHEGSGVTPSSPDPSPFLKFIPGKGAREKFAFKPLFLFYHQPDGCAHEGEFLTETIFQVFAVMIRDKAGMVGKKNKGGG